MGNSEWKVTCGAYWRKRLGEEKFIGLIAAESIEITLAFLVLIKQTNKVCRFLKVNGQIYIGN